MIEVGEYPLKDYVCIEESVVDWSGGWRLQRNSTSEDPAETQRRGDWGAREKRPPVTEINGFARSSSIKNNNHLQA